MQTVEVKVQCAKESYELGQGIAKFVAATKSALANGWQVGQDLPVIMTAALTELVPSLDGADKIVAEYGEDKNAVLNSVHHGLVEPLMSALKPTAADDVVPV